MTRDRTGRIQREDLTGQVFGELTVMRFDHYSASRKTYWRCRCSCSKVQMVRADSLKDGSISSCGHVARACRLKACTRHGMNRRRARHPVYSIFYNFRKACRNPKSRDYRGYGARGIELRFDNFKELLAHVGEKPGLNFRLERIDKDGHVEAGNLRWVELKRRRRTRCRPVSPLLNGANKRRKVALSPANDNYKLVLRSDRLFNSKWVRSARHRVPAALAEK